MAFHPENFHFRRDIALPVCCFTSLRCRRLTALAIWAGAFAWVDRLHEAGQTGGRLCRSDPQDMATRRIMPVLLRWQRAADQPGVPDRGRTADSRTTVRGAFSSTTIDYDVVIPFKHRLLEMAWTRFRAGARKTWYQPTNSSARAGRLGWKITRCSGVESQIQRRLLSRVAGGIGATEAVRSRASPARPRERDRSGSPGAVPAVPAGQQLKEYARAKGVRLIGDLPFFVSPDSSDVWANPELFLLDEQRRPRFVAGVPPDYFSATGTALG